MQDTRPLSIYTSVAQVMDDTSHTGFSSSLQSWLMAFYNVREVLPSIRDASITTVPPFSRHNSQRENGRETQRHHASRYQCEWDCGRGQTAGNVINLRRACPNLTEYESQDAAVGFVAIQTQPKTWQIRSTLVEPDSRRLASLACLASPYHVASIDSIKHATQRFPRATNLISIADD